MADTWQIPGMQVCVLFPSLGLTLAPALLSFEPLLIYFL